MREIAIVGGGPAGAMCGERLARSGYSVTIYDEHLAWEKPCGGGLTHKAIQAYPFLLNGPHPKKLIHSVELISSKGHRALLQLDQPIVIYSRTVLNGLLLDRAEAAGCRVVRSRVTHMDTSGNRANLSTSDSLVEADFVVVAAGARNSLLADTSRLAPGDLEMTLGYFVPAQAEGISVKFLSKFEGYIWSFPRCDHLSVGICGSMAKHTSQELRRHLHAFMDSENISREGARFYSHVLPSPQKQTLSSRRVVGKNWALVGDAAAWVDPITGEGLYYALRSGELLAESIIAEKPSEYPARIRKAFSTDLEFATRIARRFYRGNFLGGAVATRMIQFIERSATFRVLMADVFAGSQDYCGLKRRLWAQCGTTLTEVVGSLMKSQPSLTKETTAAGSENVR
ncbi:MAG TPA: NAD(P)/FAD-dependent oxidoreductase [Candidatus Saccharimonadales bacterium]|jgi:flavin-dependent dehydrogenase|nr:NAD(P)/FAD-dependent oxidoreductase [Candidatus Saccharimonadales bacterium]